LWIRPNAKARAATKNFDIAAEGLTLAIDWFQLHKATYFAYGWNYEHSIRYVLEHEGWNRIVQMRLKSEPRCRKVAYQYCRSHPDNGLIRKDGDRYTLLVHPMR